jgi:hypothetical protein
MCFTIKEKGKKGMETQKEYKMKEERSNDEVGRNVGTLAMYE